MLEYIVRPVFAAFVLWIICLATCHAQNYALNFDGIDDRVDGNNMNLPQGSMPRTFDAWINPTDTTGAHTVFSYGDFAVLERAGMLIVGGHLYWVGESNDVSGNATIPTDVWTHVAISYDGIAVSLYVNGVLDLTAPLPNGPAQTSGNEWSMSNTSGDPSTREPFAGQIDEVKVWNTALTGAQIIASMNGCLTANASGLVAYYRLNDGPGSATAADSSPSGSTGVLSNMDTQTAWVPDVLPINVDVCAPVFVSALTPTAMVLLVLLMLVVGFAVRSVIVADVKLRQ